MPTPLRVLVIEDSPDDAALVERALRRGGYEPVIRRVDTPGDLRTAMDGAEWDVVICDYAMPHFDAPAALGIVRERGIDLPFIIVSGTIGEETAVAAMKAGAHDYLMKNNLVRLVAAVERELREAQVRREHRRAAQAEREQRALTERQVQRLAALRTIDTAITSSLDLRVTLDVILDQVTSQLQADAASVLLLNQRLQSLDYAAGRGFRTRSMLQTRLRLGEGLAGRCAVERRTIYQPDLRKAAGEVARHDLLLAEGFVTYHATPLIAKGRVVGILEVFHRSPFSADPDWMGFLEALAGQAAIAIDNAALFTDLQRANIDLTLAYDTTLEGWSRALDLRDRETEGHTQRVTDVTLRLARTAGMREEELVHVRRGALLHDIGKMGIPDSILLKPAPLTEDEWTVMRKHPIYAYEMLSPIAYLQPALAIPYCHHEKWNGTGYPRGLRGEQIPLAARIFAVVDVWDALRSDRPYRPAWQADKALEYIERQAGTHFDPAAAEAFLRFITSEAPLAE